MIPMAHAMVGRADLGGSIVTGNIRLSGDETDGDDELLLSGDEQSGTDKLTIVETI